jgi:hypothetical protein
VSTPSKTITRLEDIQPALQWAFSGISKGLEYGPVVLTLGREGRTLSQNAKLWPLLEDISKHVEWYGKRYTREEWKDIITGSFHKCEFVPNIEGSGFVVVGLSTSSMDKATFSALIEFIFSFGADKQVPWSDPALAAYEQYGTKA